jgi:two-component system, LuxR family, sensor kinase FixL
LTNPVEINVLVATIQAMIRARSAERDVLRAAHRWQTTFDTMNDAICIVNLQGVITQCNKALENLLEKPVEELIDSSFLELIDMNSDQDNPLTHIQENQKRAETVIRFQSRWLNFAADPIFDIKGNIREFICILTDVTEVREYMLRLQMSNAELESFASVASHDLREPLHKIHIFSSRLYQKYETVLGTEGQEYFERMQAALKRGLELIDDLLEYSKITTEARAFNRVDLNHVIKDVLSDLEDKIMQAGATVEVSELPIIEANESQMYRLFQNLLSNAVKYRHSDRQPLISVFASATTEEPQYSQIHVKDNGIGIKEKDFERIFGLFERVHAKHQYKGTGIGLAICKKLVDQHHGVIHVSSVPDEGSEFIVKLPRKQNRIP